MQIILSEEIKLNVVIRQSSGTNTYPVIFLHGFTGSSSDWTPFLKKLPKQFQPVAIDLIGHGLSSSPEDKELYCTESIVNQLNEIFDQLRLNNITIFGYSMGGRAALSYAAKYPHRIKALILESATAGIIDERERQERIRSDERLADFIEMNTIDQFVDYWVNLPIFNSQKTLSQEIKLKSKARKLSNSPKGLANSLRGFSTGKMPALWDLLPEIKCRILLISGGLDEKFTRINRLMSERMQNSVHKIIEGAGHNTHLEKPEVFLNLVMEFLKEIPSEKY